MWVECKPECDEIAHYVEHQYIRVDWEGMFRDQLADEFRATGVPAYTEYTADPNSSIDIILPTLSLFLELKTKNNSLNAGKKQVDRYAKRMYSYRGLDGKWLGAVMTREICHYRFYVDGEPVDDWVTGKPGVLRSVSVPREIDIDEWDWCSQYARMRWDGRPMLECGKCKEVKDVAEFYPNRTRPIDLDYNCVDCLNENRVKKYYSDPDYREQKRRQREEYRSREGVKEREKILQRKRMADPDYRAEVNRRARKKYWELKQTEEGREKLRAKWRKRIGGC